MMTKEEAQLEVWKVTIDVQKHFNDLSLRVRSIAITVLGAFLAAASVTFKEVMPNWYAGGPVWLTGLILFAALICWNAFYFMDQHWYHRLLRGAVKHGKELEDTLKTRVPGVGLTTAIDYASPVLGLRAKHRLTIFYGVISALLIAGVGVVLQMHAAYYGMLAAALVVGLIDLILDARKEERRRSRPDGQAQPASGSD
jgi:hypothetical protein